MDLLRQAVIHKTFGKGEIVAFDGNYLTALFGCGEKRFIFPDAFYGFMTMSDPVLSAQIKQHLDAVAEGKRKMQEEKQQEQELARQRIQSNNITRIAKPSTKVYPRANIAFKCNFCDGGQSSKQIGFYGVCSDAIIYNNIVLERRTWCNSEDCPCLHYFNKEISRDELDSKCKNDGFVCYESQMLRDWKALASIVQRGENKHKPMKLNQVQENSLCILTTRYPQSTEKERYIFAVFLVDETYQGDGQDEGYVSTNSEYKIKLSPSEAHRLLFWNYNRNENKPAVAAWNSGLHRYFDDVQAAKILRDIAELKVDTPDEYLAQCFFKHFCSINRIDLQALGSADGALKI